MHAMFCDLLSGDRKCTRCFAIFSQEIANARDVLRSSLRRSQTHAMFCDLLSGDRKLMAKSQFLACRGWTPRDPQCASTIVRHRVCKRNRGREAAEMSFKCMSPNTFHRRTTAEDKRFKGVSEYIGCRQCHIEPLILVRYLYVYRNRRNWTWSVAGTVVGKVATNATR